MMATEHIDTVYDLINGITGLTVYKGYVRELDADAYPAAFIVQTGGPAPSPFFGGGIEEYKQAAVQIAIIGAPRAFQAAESLTREVYDAVAFKTPAGYTAIRPQSDYQTLGVDENDRPDFRVNVLCQLVE